jgi:predicted DNA binding CopG/RHH family protein
MEATQNITPEQPERGRPAKEESKKLTRSINLKLTGADFDIVAERAASVGMKTTQYARQMVLNGSIKSRYTKEELDLRRKIAGMANNMNQVARIANKDGFKEAEFIAYHLFMELKPLLYDR